MYSELLFTPPPLILCVSRAFQLRQGFYQLQQSAAPLALLLVPCVVEQPLRAEDQPVSGCPALQSTVLAGPSKGDRMAWKSPGLWLAWSVKLSQLCSFIHYSAVLLLFLCSEHLHTSS